MATNGGDVLASELMLALLTGEDVSIPTIDFSGSEYSIPGDINSDAYDVLVRLSDSDLTTGAINGTGAFDKLMVGVAAQLQREYDAGRITGVEYAKAYIALTGSALSSSLQYLLSRDAAYWQAVQAQAASVTARVQLATAKAQNAAAQLEAMNIRSNYALTKLRLAKEDTEFASAKYNLEEILPTQKLNLQEQAEAQRGQTMDTRSNGITPIAGSIGKQNALYAQQIVSYQKDSQLKAGKIFSDIWTVQKTVDESPNVPDAFGYETINDVMQTIITSNGLVV